MRRVLHGSTGTDGQVAIYDALLFLMVAVLISEGMFLYTATVASDGGSFSDDHYQHLADTQRITVEALSLNGTHPTPGIPWRNATDSSTLPLEEVVGEPEAQTVRWLLASYCELTWRNEEGDEDGAWDPDAILPLVDAYFRDNRLNGTEHAWLFLYEGEVVLFNGSTNATLETLPEERWASSFDYSHPFLYPFPDGGRWSAELRYFLWLP